MAAGSLDECEVDVHVVFGDLEQTGVDYLMGFIFLLHSDKSHFCLHFPSSLELPEINSLKMFTYSKVLMEESSKYAKYSNGPVCIAEFAAGWVYLQPPAAFPADINAASNGTM